MVTDEQFKAKQLEILHELDRVCQAVGVRYYLAYGTCLGAVRHQGFIPWDDDIDVFLLHRDMKRLIDNRQLFGEKYFLQGMETESNFTLMKHNLRDSSTSYFTDADDNEDINHGMYIDLYTLYPYPDGFFAAHKLIVDTYVYRILCAKRAPLHHGNLGRVLYWIVNAIYSGKRAERKKDRVRQKLEHNGGKEYLATFYGHAISPLHAVLYPKYLFEEPKYLKFEDFSAPCPTDPEKVCEITYGRTYLQFPPVEQRISNHQVRYMSCEEPYKIHRGKYYCLSQGDGE